MPAFSDIGKPIIIASHPRSGTHLTIDLLRKQFTECHSWKKRGEPLDRLYFALEAFSPKNPLDETTALNILQRPERPIIKTHANPELSYLNKNKPNWATWLQNADTLYILRDGRAVMPSLHLFMQSYNPSTRCSLSEFIRQKQGGVSRVGAWTKHVQSWLDKPNVTPIHFEDIVKKTGPTLDVIGQAIDLTPLHRTPLLPSRIKNLWHGRWIRLTQTQPESSAIIGFYKGQQVQKWQTAFTQSDREFFHQEAGELLIQLGYENSDAWVTQTKTSAPPSNC